jgi:hypothetical protein
MSRTLQFKRYPASAVANTTGANGELIINTTDFSLTVHDGVTLGGHTVSASAVDTTARTTASAAFNAANTKLSTTGGTISGSLSTTGNTTVNQTLQANTVIVDSILFSGLASRSNAPLPNLIAQFASNSSTYVQVNQQNINPLGSADYVVTADNGTDTSFYIDLGLHNSDAFDKILTPYDGYLIVQGSTIGQSGGNLIIGTTSSFAGLETKFVAGGYEANNTVMKLGTYGANVVGNLTVTGTTKSKVPGPYANDSAASSGGVLVGQMYYRTDGTVHVRLT